MGGSSKYQNIKICPGRRRRQEGGGLTDQRGLCGVVLLGAQYRDEEANGVPDQRGDKVPRRPAPRHRAILHACMLVGEPIVPKVVCNEDPGQHDVPEPWRKRQEERRDGVGERTERERWRGERARARESRKDRKKQREEAEGEKKRKLE